MNRKNIEYIIRELDELSKYSTYREFEVALISFLRSDIYGFRDLTDKNLKELDEIIENTSSLINLDTWEIDSLFEKEDEEDE